MRLQTFIQNGTCLRNNNITSIHYSEYAHMNISTCLHVHIAKQNDNVNMLERNKKVKSLINNKKFQRLSGIPHSQLAVTGHLVQHNR